VGWAAEGFGVCPSKGKVFLISTSSRLVLGPTQPPVQRVQGSLSLGVKRLGREADHSPLTSAKVENTWICTSQFHRYLHGVVLNQLSTGITLPPLKVKVKSSLYRSWRPLELREIEASTFSDIRLIYGGKVVSLTRRLLFNLRKIPGTCFCWRLSRPQDHSAAGRIT
jgi:hypothetical protein